jgi:heterodisulfide reductase subunit A
VDILHLLHDNPSMSPQQRLTQIAGQLEMAISQLKQADPEPGAGVEVAQRALVVGGGMAGMSAALAIADVGYGVDLVERQEQLGGNLSWLATTLDGASPEALLQETTGRVDNHPLIRVHLGSQIIGSFGQVGHFFTTLEDQDHPAETLEHGVTILATGGREAHTEAYHYGAHPAVITQKEMEQMLATDPQKASQHGLVVMIQCVGSREEPRNFCSRVCCPTAVKHALHLKKLNPEMAIYVLYRDMMTCGFNETYFTQARQAGIIFIPYEKDRKPHLTLPDTAAGGDPNLQVDVFEPIIGRDLALEADLVVLATGVEPQLPDVLTDAFGIRKDSDGFFQEAESKWRPVDALKEGVFACGLSLAPGNLAETIASGEAAAQRALRILTRKQLPASRITAQVRHSLCSQCELCIEACPYEARSLDLEQHKIWVNPAMCQGCGACAAVCPNSASVLSGFKDAQMMDQIDVALPLASIV